MSSTFYASNDVSRRKKYWYVIVRLRNSCLITFYKKYRSSYRRCRSSHRSCSVKKGLLRNFANFTGKHNQVADLQSASFLQKRFQHKCFPVKFAKLLRTPILQNICNRLLLEAFYKKLFLKTLQYSQDESS